MLSRVTEKFSFVLIVSFLLGSGGIGTVLVSRALVRSTAVWTWETRQCRVEDVRVIEHEAWHGIYFRSQYEVLFDLRDTENGRLYKGATVTRGSADAWETADLHLLIGPRAPGALIDCWVAGDGVTAIVQRDAWWLIAMEIVGLVFTLLLFVGGVIVIKPSLMK